jgi:hypothetical protein
LIYNGFFLVRMLSFSQKNPRDTLKIASTQLARLAHGGTPAWNHMKSSMAKPVFTKGRTATFGMRPFTGKAKITVKAPEKRILTEPRPLPRIGTGN